MVEYHQLFLQKALSRMFDWVPSASPIMQGFFFLLLSIEVATFNLPRTLDIMISILSKYFISSRNFLFRCNRIMFETCSNLTMRNQNGVDKVVLVSLLLTSNMLKRVNDQVNATGKKIGTVTSLIS